MTTFRGLPPDVELDPERDPVPRPCVVNLDAVESLSVTVLVDRLGRLADARLREICHAPADAVQCTR